jgi:hypothetical protein
MLYALELRLQAMESLSAPAGSRFLRLSRIRRHVKKQINLIAARMSGDPGGAGTPMFRLGDGSADTPV